MDSYVINCVLTNLISQATVTWEIGTKVENLGLLSVDQGTIADHTQTSVLTLTSSQLEKVKQAGGNNPDHEITCKINVGVINPKYITASQTVSIYKPCEFLIQLF